MFALPQAPDGVRGLRVSQEGNTMRAVWAVVLVGLLACVPACRSSSRATGKGDANQGKPASARPQDLIVGMWDSINEPARRTLEFGKDGALAIRQEGQPEMKGPYKFTADEALELEFTRPRGEKAKEPITVKVGTDELSITGRDQKVQQFRRRT